MNESYFEYVSMMFRFLILLHLLLIGDIPSHAAERPNVVILLSDDLGWQDLRCYGGPVKTPALDRLAGGGVRFTHFYAGAAVCSPSRATLLTGRHHLRTGVYSWIDDHTQRSHLLPRETTLAEHLKQAGYRTGHFGKWHLGLSSSTQTKPSPSDHGFDTWFATRNNAGPSHHNPINFIRNGKNVGPLKGYACDIVADEAIRWMEQEAEKPFFLNVWFNEPHAPLAAPEELVREYDGDPDAALYSATIDNADRAIERILDTLQRLGIAENTLVIYSSDNGSYRADRVGGLRGTKGSNYEGGIRVPGIISWPGTIPARRVIEEPAGQLDLLPTICGLVGIAPPTTNVLDGTNLAPLLLGTQNSLRREKPLAWILPMSGQPLALREGPWSLIGYRNGEMPRDRKAMARLYTEMKTVLAKHGDPDPAATLKARLYEGLDVPEAEKLRGQYIRLNQFQESWIPALKRLPYERFELYDLASDPAQERNVAREHPEVFERLKRQLLALKDEVMAEAPDWTRGPERPKGPQGPKSLLRSLPSLRSLPTLRSAVQPLIDASCIDCHDADTNTPLNLEALAFDLEDPDTFRKWEKVHDAIVSGEMPPKKKKRPDPALLEPAQATLSQHLFAASAARQTAIGRVPARRLTRLEYEYTLHDLFDIDTPLADLLPPESDAMPFNTMTEGQEMAPLHIRSYLEAADAALDDAIELGPRPSMKPQTIDYRNHSYMQMWFKRELRRGGNVVLRTEDAFVTFDTRPHATQSNHLGLRFSVAGSYRITAEAFGYQAKTPVTFCVYRCNDQEGRRDLIATRQLSPGNIQHVSWTRNFRPDDYFYIAPADHDWGPSRKPVLMVGAKVYDGEGLGIRKLQVEGPLETEWPPTRTRDLLGDVKYVETAGGYRVEPTRAPRLHIQETVGRIGPRLFRRPLSQAEVETWVRLADTPLAQDRGWVDALRVVLRGMLCAPDFLYQPATPGPLTAEALATRLSYLLWKSLPDESLMRLARDRRLNDSTVLRSEVDRLLDDPRARRFVDDFTDQWLRLDEIDATTPSAKLFPEYDDVLRQAMLEETRLFVADAFRSNRPLRVLIDANYTFVNRRLAEHYGIPGVDGLSFRRVHLPADSLRGGLLGQASVLKVTANGTNTSPVPRGNFVLRRLLGVHMPPPPPDAGAVEPDTRGATTIRETLAAHRDVASCQRCHMIIDPPGFALEQFDPIGGFRTRYRSTDKGDRPKRTLFGRPVHEYKLGPVVDASGQTANGETFDGFRAFKRLLLRDEDAIARHVVHQLIAYGTGAEVQFADRAEVESLLHEAKADGYPLRDLLHAVIQSRLFRNK